MNSTTSTVPIAVASPPVTASACWPSLRWLVICVFTLCNILNFMDRQALAALAPGILREFHLTNAQYGGLISAFSLTYAVTTPLAGWLVDRAGVNAGASVAVCAWSLGGIFTGFARTFRELILCRGLLGFGEAAGLPFLAKATAVYLPPAEWGLANAVGSIAVTLGSMAAPLTAAQFAPRFGWRSVFIVSGALGFLWVVVWLHTAARIPSKPVMRRAASIPIARIISDRRFWRVVAAYPLVMLVFVVWLNWTTLFLVHRYGLSEVEANRSFAWIPPVFATVGGFANGGLTYLWIRRGMDAISARVRISVWLVPMLVGAATAPVMPSAAMAVGAIALGMFAAQGIVSSLNVIPIDLFGPGRAGFCISLLACSYALMQTFAAPVIGRLVDDYGFFAVSIFATIFCLTGIWLLLDLRRVYPARARSSMASA